MNIYNYQKIIFIFTFTFNVAASSNTNSFHTVLENYQKKNSVIMNVEKTFIQKILNKQTQSSGKFTFSKTLWRYDIHFPEASSIVHTGKKTIFYNSKTNVKHYIENSKIPVLSMLFNKKNFYKNFKYENEKIKGRTKIYSFSGLLPSSPEKLFIQIEKDRILSIQILWKPPLGEEYYQFSSIQFNKKLDNHLFKEPLTSPLQAK